MSEGNSASEATDPRLVSGHSADPRQRQAGVPAPAGGLQGPVGSRRVCVHALPGGQELPKPGWTLKAARAECWPGVKGKRLATVVSARPPLAVSNRKPDQQWFKL